ncbi:hypothetical protein FSARC_14575 [Fusarium sarcochroum]|uniref:Uncharacterized protein n=1 Tax=Fusarium sarcochroum TaxID=1208366 RepID=A0A8H4SSP1_9HYPO|nr:hypothetical protein FSARC_14575 [Fusarium sarcochroum]
MGLSGLTLEDLRDGEELRILNLPPGTYVRCPKGRSRAKAIHDIGRLGRWWTVELYTELTLHQEIVRYLEHILDIWTTLMGSKEALQHVDPEAVRELELRVPGVSRRDRAHVAAMIISGEVFKGLSDHSEREKVLNRISDIKYLIPSIFTLQRDFGYLKPCINTLIGLIHGEGKPAYSAQVLAYSSFVSHSSTNLDALFMRNMKCLYLYIMQDIVNLTGESLLVGKGKRAKKVNYRHPRSWHLLAKRAQELGFVSAEINRLALDNPDCQVALTALHDARPPSQYKFDDLQLPGLVDSIVGTFEEAMEYPPRADTTSFTTTSIGEPIKRRCGCQYFDAYVCDRWMFKLSEFSRSTPESTDITSLFVRKSVFHAFWRVEEEEDETMPLANSPDTPPQNESNQVEQGYLDLSLNEQGPSTQFSLVQLEDQDAVEWRQGDGDQLMIDALSTTRIWQEASGQQLMWPQQGELQQIQQMLGESSSQNAFRPRESETSMIPIQDGPGWDLIKPLPRMVQIRRWQGAEWHNVCQCDRHLLWEEIQKLGEQNGDQSVLDPESGRPLCKDDLADFTGEIVCIAGKDDDVPLKAWPAYEI